MTRWIWFSRLLLACSGGIGALALPPHHLIFLLIPAVTILIWKIICASRPLQAFGVGWWFGFGHGLIGYYWIANAFLVDSQTYGFLAPFAVAGLAVGLAIFPGLTATAVWVLCRWRGSSPLGFILIFAALWGVSEWVRSWFLTGFPWNLVATIWTFSPEILQVVAAIGPYGLGMLTIAGAGLPTLFLINEKRRTARVVFSTGLIVFSSIWLFGHIRLESASHANIDGVKLRLVQPNIPQHLKWQNNLRIGHVKRQLRLSTSPTTGSPPTHVIWAETAVPFNLSADAALRDVISTAVPEGGFLITGAPRSEISEDGQRHAYNSILAIDAKGTIAASYDKRHLVPFGEYIPLRWILKVSKLTAGRIDFQPGTRARIFDLVGLPPARMLICYEVIFPADIVDSERRPSWILNLTNDAWFGRSAGPHQHLAAAQLRAAEQGLPVVRVANTGISAVIDAYGRVDAFLALGEEGYLDNPLPEALAEPLSYGKYGDILTLVFVLFGMATLLLPKLNR